MTAQEYLKAIRDKHWTQAQIAEHTKIPQGTISKIERGQKDVLSKTYLALQNLYHELQAAPSNADTAQSSGAAHKPRNPDRSNTHREGL